MRDCGKCHTCGGALRLCLDGEEWCQGCQSYRRYRSHGWARSTHTDDNATVCRGPADWVESGGEPGRYRCVYCGTEVRVYPAHATPSACGCSLLGVALLPIYREAP